MITYDDLITYLKNQSTYLFTIKKNYLVILIPNIDYHITVFADQWDNYELSMYKPYHLFHISSNSEVERCSSYYWVDKEMYRIRKIPKKYFKYNQPTYGFDSSTRSPCDFVNVKNLLTHFQKILWRIRF